MGRQQVKVAVVVASRANYSRLKSVLQAIEQHPRLQLQLIVAGSALLDRWGCVDLIEAEFEIQERLYCVVDGDRPQNMAATTGVLMQYVSNTLARLRPNIVLVHADRYEMLAVATAAAYMNIPVAHTEGGEDTGSIDDKVRYAISHLADLHFPVTEKARQKILSLDIPDQAVTRVGSPSLDLLAGIDWSRKPDLMQKYGGVGPCLDLSQPYLVVLQHPVTTEYGATGSEIQATLDAVRDLRMQTVWFWPNVDAGQDAISEALRRFREIENPDYVHFFKNLSPEDFGRLLKGCSCLLGNTSAGIKEGAFLGVPYVCIGTRQNGREHGKNTVFVDYDTQQILSAVRYQLGQIYEPDFTFGDGYASERIAAHLEAYYESRRSNSCPCG